MPTTGGTFTGTINVNGLGGVTTNGGLGGDLIPQTSAADNGRYRMGLGTNLTWNGNSWVSLTDGAHNGSAIMYSDIFGSLIAFGLYPSNGTSNRLLTPTDIDNGVKMYIDTNGNLNVNGNVSTTVGNVNGANLNATNAVSTNTINMSKKQISSNYGISTINFAAEVNDPGFITHEENNNASIMKFSVSDDASGDYFSWGSTPSGTYTEAMRLVTSGAATLNGAWTANDFVIPSDRTLKQNITDVTNGLEIVESLKPVEFDMIKNSTHKSGFIAQDVLQVLPHAVSQSEDGLYKLSEHQIIPYLVDAIQKLNKRLKELEK